MQGVAQDSGPNRQLFSCVGQSGLGTFAVSLNFVELCSDLRLGKGRIGGEVDQSRFFVIEFAKTSGQRCMHVTHAGLVVSNRLFELLAHGRGEIAFEPQSCVVLNDCFFDTFGAQMWQVTESILASAAEEIAVPLPGLTCCLRVDEACCSSGIFAPLAEERPFQVMRQNPVALSALATKVQDVLYTIEKFMANDRLMTTRVYGSLVDDKSRVVRIAQHLVHLCI